MPVVGLPEVGVPSIVMLLYARPAEYTRALAMLPADSLSVNCLRNIGAGRIAWQLPAGLPPVGLRQ